jgi:hypothetical protein
MREKVQAGGLAAESIERYLEDQAFSPSYDLDPTPPASCPSSSVFLCVAGRECIVHTEDRVGGGGGLRMVRKPSLLYIIQYPLLRCIWKEDGSLEDTSIEIRKEVTLEQTE